MGDQHEALPEVRLVFYGPTRLAEVPREISIGNNSIADRDEARPPEERLLHLVSESVRHAYRTGLAVGERLRGTEVDRLRSIIELYRVHMAVCGGPPPRCTDPALCGAMELCLEDLGEPVTRTDGIALVRLHVQKGAEAILTRRTRELLGAAREKKRRELAEAGAKRIGLSGCEYP